MGLYDDITPDALRADLRHFAELILRLDAEDTILEATPRLLRVLGDLRAKIFAYEVRVTGRLFPREEKEAEPKPKDVEEAKRIVEEAIQRFEEAEREWSQPWDPDETAD
jgi:hypothetical protein